MNAMAAPTVTELIAASAATPVRTLTALLDLTRHAADGNPALRVALAGNPALPAESLATIASGATSQVLRTALVTNPAVTPEQVRQWVMDTWGKPQLGVLRAAIRRVPDPDGALAQHAMATQGTIAILHEIVASPNTSEAARIDAAMRIAARPKVKGSERAKVVALGRRDADTLRRLHVVAENSELRAELVTAMNIQRRGRHGTERSVQSRTSLTLSGWLNSSIEQSEALTVLAQDRRAATWRAAANACRPGWDTVAQEVLADATRRLESGSSSGRTNAIALLRNPAVNSTTAFKAALLVAADPTNVSYDIQSAIIRVAHTHAHRVSLAQVAQSDPIVSWLAMREPDLPADAVNHLAHAWSHGTATARRRYGHMAALSLLARTELSDAAAAGLVAALARDENHGNRHRRAGALPGDADVLALPWHDAPTLDAHCRQQVWSSACAAEVLWSQVHQRRSALLAAPSGTDPLTFLGDLPAAVLRLAPGNGYAPVLTGAVAQMALSVAGNLPGTLDAAAASLRILEMVASGFPGTLAELSITLSAALAP